MVATSMSGVVQNWVRNAVPIVGDGIYRVDTNASEFAAAYDAVGGTRIFERQEDPFSSSRYQGLQYETALRDMLAELGTLGAVLDVGCGDGRGLAWLSDGSPATVVGVDVSLDALRRCRHRFPQEFIHLVHGSILDLELAPQSFDVVLAIESLHYLSDEYETGIALIAHCLRPGGLFLSSEPDWEAGLLHAAMRGHLEELDGLARHRQTIEQIDEPRRVRSLPLAEKNSLLLEHGFREVNRRGISALPLFLIELYHKSGGQSARARAAIIDVLGQIAARETTFNRLYLTAHRLDGDAG